VAQQLAHLVAWLDPHALLLALLLPPVIRLVGHWIPEELFMVAMGVLAARAASPGAAAALLGAVLASHLVTDHAVYLAGRWLRTRMARFPRFARPLGRVTERLEERPGALLGLIPARVLPLGRGAWLAGCGVVRAPWSRFALVDLAALLCHLGLWSGLGWWLAGDLRRVEVSAEVGRITAFWSALAVVLAISAVAVWRRRPRWQPATVAVARRAGQALRSFRR
jgi:membrane protein DedA with SNARE-associated domain